MSLERNTYTTPHVINISFIKVVLNLISYNEMKEIVVVKDLPYSDVGNMLQKNILVLKKFLRGALGFFAPLIISESNEI